MNTYHISNSNGMGGGVWAREYDSRKAAAAAIAEAFGWDDAVLSPSWDDDDGNRCWCAYETREECDADDTGADAPCITRVDAGAEIKINIYRSAGAWYAAVMIDGEHDSCDELDVDAGASEADAHHEAMRMPLTVAGTRTVRRVEDV